MVTERIKLDPNCKHLVIRFFLPGILSVGALWARWDEFVIKQHHVRGVFEKYAD